MRRIERIECVRCGCTESYQGIDSVEFHTSHVCPDGGKSLEFRKTVEMVPGPGERGRDPVES